MVIAGVDRLQTPGTDALVKLRLLMTNNKIIKLAERKFDCTGNSLMLWDLYMATAKLQES